MCHRTRSWRNNMRMAMFLDLKSFKAAPSSAANICLISGLIYEPRLISGGSIRLSGSCASSLGTYLGHVVARGTYAVAYNWPRLLPLPRPYPLRLGLNRHDFTISLLIRLDEG